MSTYVRLVDIAEKVGVTVNTVSRALNGKPGVSEETRAVITQAAKEMGYHPNAMARSLRGYSPNIIGVILLNCSNPFLAAVLRSIDEHAASLGYHILMFNIERDNSKTIEAIKILTSIRAQGIIMQPCAMNVDIEREIDVSSLPFVIYGYGSSSMRADVVRSNDELGGYTMMKYLLSKGYESISYLTQENSILAFRERFTGARRAAAEAGLGGESIGLISIDSIDLTYDYIVRMHAEGRLPRCIFCANDLMAIETMAALRDCGVDIPGEVAVAGYDGSPVRRTCHVPLTTIFSDYKAIGDNCVEMLHNRISGRAGQSYHSIVIDPRLEVNTSA